MLEYLSGLHIDRMEQSHSHEVEEWRSKYEQANAEREASIDSIARGMAELAASSSAPAAGTPAGGFSVSVAAPTSAAAAEAGQASDQPLVEITDEDMAQCTNCKTCYEDLGELFEKTTIMVDGESKVVSRVIPGIFDKIEITPELIKRARKVADNCDAEIIRFHNQG
jgi:pyruvate-ferredoxin/flavodoxin oxidoreductase